MARKTNLPAPPGAAADGAGLERLDGPEAAARLYALAGAEEEGRGLLLHVWTVDREEDIRRLVEAGIDAVITNRPDVARRIVG